MKSSAEMYYAIKEAIQVMEHYDTGEDFALVSSLRRLREIEKDGLSCSEGCDWPNCTRSEMNNQEKEKLTNQILHLKGVLRNCETTFGAIDRIFKVLREADDSNLRNLIDGIDLDLPLAQAKIKESLKN